MACSSSTERPCGVSQRSPMVIVRALPVVHDHPVVARGRHLWRRIVRDRVESAKRQAIHIKPGQARDEMQNLVPAVLAGDILEKLSMTMTACVAPN